MTEAAYQTEEFPHIEYRETIIGPQAFITGTRLKIWHLIPLERDTGWDAEAIAKHYGFDHYGLEASVAQEALVFAHQHSAEMDEDIARNASYDVEKLRAMLPDVRVYEVPDDGELQ